MNNTDYGPAVRFPPPIGTLLIIITAELINRLAFPVTFDFHNIPVAIALYLLATTIVAVTAINFRKHETNITPFSPDTSLMTNGVFSISRNPIYISFFLYQIMFAFVFHNLWQIFLLPATWAFLRFYVINKEENYLTKLFGQAYTDYCNQVRRWL